MWKGQQLTKGQGDEADACRGGWGSAGHQLQELLCLLICRSAEGSHSNIYYIHKKTLASFTSTQDFLRQIDPPFIWQTYTKG